MDENGITINKKPPIPWPSVCAVGVDHTLLTAAGTVAMNPLGRFLPWSFIWLSPPCLHVCVFGDAYPRPARAVKFSRRGAITGHSHDDRRELVELFGAWAELVPVFAPGPDLNAWWGTRREAHPPRAAAPLEPTTHDRVVASQHELKQLQDELDRINLRKKHDLPPT